VWIPGKTFRPYDPEFPSMSRRGDSVNRPVDLLEISRIMDERRAVLERRADED